MVREMGTKQVDRAEGKHGHWCMYLCKSCNGKMRGLIFDTLVFVMKYMKRSAETEGTGRDPGDSRKEQ